MLSGMIRLSVMYPAGPESTFDWDYYLGAHLKLAHRLLDPRGLIRIEIDRGIGSFPPGAAAPYHAVGHLFFHTMADLEAALGAAAEQLIADAQKYSNRPSVVQISEVVR